jgi:hypothetical protein
MDHEYSILNHDRGRVLLLIGSLIAIAAGVYTSYVGVAKSLISHYWPSFGVHLPATLDFTTAWALMYAGFNRLCWKLPGIRHVLDLPKIDGTWLVSGITEGPQENLLPNGNPRSWSGEVVVVQTWTRIFIKLRTANSASVSKSAAVQMQPDGTIKLMYSYGNEPNMGAASRDNLKAHVGYCELVFDPEHKQARGHYFNNIGRVSYGTMELTRKTT